MADFTPNNKSSQASFTTQSKDADAWTNLLHSDIEAAGMDYQTMDDSNTGMDDAGNTIITSWTIVEKETG